MVLGPGLVHATLLAFLVNVLAPIHCVYAQPAYSAGQEFNLPKPGSMIALSARFYPAIITGIMIHPENPLEFDFIVDTGDDHLHGKRLKSEAQRLINYFMATLTVPDEQVWVTH